MLLSIERLSLESVRTLLIEWTRSIEGRLNGYLLGGMRIERTRSTLTVSAY